MKRTKFLLLSIIVGLFMSLPVEAWVAAGARGVAVGGFGAGCYHGAYGGAVGYGGGVAYRGYGGAAAWNYGSGYVAAGYRGPTAWNHSSGYAVDRFGGSYHGAYGRSVSWVR